MRRLPRLFGLQGVRGRPRRRQVRAEGPVRPRELRDRRGPGRQDAGLWRVRRPADLVRHRAQEGAPLGGAHAKWIRRRRLEPGRQGRRQRGRRHGLPAVGRRDRQAAPRAARARREDAARTSGRCSTRPRSRPTASTWRPATRSARCRSGRWRPASRSASVEAPVMYTWDPVAAAALDRRHPRRWPSRRTARRWPSAGSGKIGNIDHLEANARIELFDWAAQKRLTEYAADKSKGLVNRLRFAPDGVVAARGRRGQRGLPAAPRPRRQEDAPAGKGRGPRPRRRHRREGRNGDSGRAQQGRRV